MALLRWPTRQIQHSISEHVKAGMASLGWFDATNTWFEHVLTWAEDHNPEQVVAAGGPEQPNTVGVSIGDAPDTIGREIGRGLQSVSLPVFIDVYGESRPVALNIADDVVQILRGELWTPSRFIPLYDYSEEPPRRVDDAAVEAQLIEARWPGQAAGQEWRHTWRMVAFTAIYWHNGTGSD